MPALSVNRTLVKSPPELWSELSEVERLADHLGKFGEIRITKVEPEKTVAWEGEHGSGTVEIEASGWGTKVTLSAAVAEASAEPAVPAAAAGPEAAEPAEAPATGWPPARGHPPAEPRRRGLLARLFGRRFAAPHPPQRSVSPTPEPLQSQLADTREEPDTELPLDAGRALAVLESVLDNLGSAHHRPFSRG